MVGAILLRIALTNFKSFRSADFDLKPFTIMYGANGAGKSNFNDALRFLRAIGNGKSIRDAIEGHYVASTYGAQGDINEGIRGGAAAITRFGTKSKVFHVSVLAGIQGHIYQYNISVDSTTYHVVAEWLIVDDLGPYVFDTHPEGAPGREYEDSPVIYANVFKKSPGRNPRRMFSASESILSQFEGRKAEFVYNEEPATLFRQELAAIQPLELRPEVLRNYSPLGRYEIGEHGEYFAAGVWALVRAASLQPDDDIPEDQVRDARSRLGAIKAWLNELSPRPIRQISTISAPTGEVIFSVTEFPQRRPVNARSLSDGTLRFAALAFALIGYPERRTYVIEEIENGISTARLGLLLRMLDSATRNESEKQVIATTHSPTILDLADKRLMSGMLFVYWDEETASSRVRRVADLAKDEILEEQKLGELLTNGYLQLAADVE